MYIYTPLCRYWITLYRYVLVFIVPHVDIELEDNKQFISNIPRITHIKRMGYTVDSRYLEVQGTLLNTSRYPYLDISDLRNLEKTINWTTAFNWMNM